MTAVTAPSGSDTALRRLLDLLATAAILADEVRQHGSLPPRIAALLGRPLTG